MKIGIVTKYLDRAVGHGTYAANLLEALAQLAPATWFNVYVPTRPSRAEWPASVSIRAAALHRSRAALAAWELVLAPRAAARDGVDLLHYLYPAGPLVPTGRPTVVSLFDVIEWTLPGYEKSSVERRLERRHLRSAARVIVPTVQVADDLQKVLEVPDEKVAVAPLGGPSIRTAPPHARQPYWLFLGGTERRKNLRLVLEALAGGDFAETRLKVVGPTSPGRRFESRSDLISLLPPDQRVRVDWLGEVAPPELDRLYGQAIALIYPSLAEGFGHPTLEAMARGTPVIASPVPSIAAGFDDAAVLIDALDPSQLRQAMHRVLSDAALRKRLVARGIELVSRYDWRETAERTLAVYRDLVGEGSRLTG